MNNEISKTFSSADASLTVIIPDTPIVSIAGGSTLSEITTTTTSTTTTPTPTLLSSEPTKANILPSKPMFDAAAKSAGTASGAAANNVSNAKKEKELPSSSAKTDEAAANETKSKNTEIWEENRLNDWDDSRLRKLLDEAYSYKNPRDKENKSEIFLQLLQKAENETEDQTFSFRAITSRFNRNSSSSTTSNSHHNHNSHHHKQGGSLQDLVDAVRNESLLDCDYNFGIGGQRNRRHNHNSRQKKYSSVSSRQREGGSLPSNVNVTNCGGLLGTVEQPLFMQEVKTGNSKQRRNAKSSSVKEVEKDNVGVGAGVSCNDSDHTICAASGDCVIEIGEPMMDIQQKQQILQSRGQHDKGAQSLPFYERMDSIEMRIPRANITSSAHGKSDYNRPNNTSNYVDDTVHFASLEHSRADSLMSESEGAICSSAPMTIDSKYLPLDENYKSCKSLLGGDKSDITKTPATLYSTTKTITRQYDENGNSLSEMYQSGSVQAAATSLHPSSNLIQSSASSALATNTIGTINQSQAKAKGKKKSQQERNTKTVDVESVAGYRGKDPIEELVKYIESTEDKQYDTKSNSSRFNENNKKKDRKKDKEKQHKMKKCNSLEELRSCAKIEVDDLKCSAATTESNVIMRNKGNGKNNKNNSSSTADINKNFENGNGKELTSNKTITGTNSSISTRKSERRSWGTEDMQYLSEENGNNEDRTKEKKVNKFKEKENDKEQKEKTTEKIEKNGDLDGSIMINNNYSLKIDKLEKQEGNKFEKRKKSNEISLQASSSSSVIGVVDILAMDSLMPETAEFHVVTKKKKPKKQRILSEDASSGININNNVSGNRAHNFINNMQKSTTASFAQQQQQRYKYYYNNPHSTTGTTNNDRDYFSNYNSNHYNNNHTTSNQYNQQQNNVSGDKSRRKSTSSVPPSEKSDSSDLDSVHSLPIESTSKNKQRHKSTAVSATPSASKIVAGNSPVPISYADIARTNKELAAAAAAADNNSIEKWPTVDAANNNIMPESSIVAGGLDDNQPTTSAQVYANLNATNFSKIKIKKVVSKPDFPELVSSSSSTSTEQPAVIKANTQKTISYSQSLTAVPAYINMTVSESLSDGLTSSTTSPTITAGPVNINMNTEFGKDPKIEKRHGMAEVAKVEVLYNNTSVPRSQQIYQQQQPLQKSKSVESESYSYNSNNMDQQYPALEKTVKRHSSTNVAAAAQLAAAKQQIGPVNTFDISPKSTMVISAPITTSNSTIAAQIPVTATNSLGKKTKDKTVCISVTFSATIQPQPVPIAVGEGLTGAFSGASVAARKSRREKEKQHNYAADCMANDEPIVARKSSMATQTSSTFIKNVNSKQLSHSSNCNIPQINPNMNNIIATNKIFKFNSTNINCANNKNATLMSTSSLSSNRPAVIILNDERDMDVSNDFIFGDFNEDELKFFDEDIINEDAYRNVNMYDSCNTRQQPQSTTASVQMQKYKLSPRATITSGAICFNDSGASSSDVAINLTQHHEDMISLSGADASSPNTSFIASHVTNQSSDSGIDTATNKSKCNELNDKRNFDQDTASPSTKQLRAYASNEQMQPFKTTSKTSNSSNASSSSSYAQPQQLETCNDIETAIIAAARAAAAEQQQNNPHPQQKYQHSNFSTSSSFSSSSSVSMDTKYPTHLQSPKGQRVCNSHYEYIHPQSQQLDGDDEIHSGSNSCDGDGSPTKVVINFQHKLFDIHFIPPSIPVAFSSVQHNDIIVDFIGSAWEEIANSKVTKYYDGQ